MTGFNAFLLAVQTAFLRFSFVLICAAALLAVAATLLSGAGVWPWLTLEAGLGGSSYPQAGMIAQIGLTCLVLMLAFYLPSSGRMLALERSHRNFSLTMEDVTRAYHMAHAGDRQGRFKLASEFDAVKERLAYMRAHPDLGDLEPGVLELAAQMSQVSHDLADTYSDEKVERARGFLRQRQEELNSFEQRLENAKMVMHELRQWNRDVEIEESIARSHLSRLREELHEILPELAAQLGKPEDPSAANSVVPMQPGRRAD